jgi:hypothetical protein
MKNKVKQKMSDTCKIIKSNKEKVERPNVAIPIKNQSKVRCD